MNEPRCQASVAMTGNTQVDTCNTLLVEGECPHHPHQPVTKKPPIGTIDIISLIPSRLAIVGLYLEMLECSEFNAEKRQGMKDEILRAAKLADLYMKEHKQ